MPSIEVPIENTFAQKFTERGGKGRGGASLTPLAKELISRYDTHASLIASQSSDILDWLRSVQSNWSADVSKSD